MSISVKCQCGRGFAAQDRLAGKTVACPTCRAGIAIPVKTPAAVSPTSIPVVCACGRGFSAEPRLAGNAFAVRFAASPFLSPPLPRRRLRRGDPLAEPASGDGFWESFRGRLRCPGHGAIVR